MEYIDYKLIEDTHRIIWLCGKPTQLTTYLLDKLKFVLAPDSYSKDGKCINYKENTVVLNGNTSVVDIEELFKEPPFLGSNYLLIGDYSDLDNKVKRRLLNLLQTSPKHIISLLYISQYRDYKSLADNKTFNIGKAVYLFRVPRELQFEYVRSKVRGEIGDKALRSYVKRTNNYENFMLYIDKLTTLPSPITSDMVKKAIPDCSDYTIYDYIKTLITRDRKTVHMKALDACLSVYKRKTYDEILNTLEVLISLKRLTLQGYILPFTLKTDLEYLEERHMLPEVLDKLSSYKISNYLEITASISLSELNLIYLCFLNTKPSTHNLYILTDLIYNRTETKQLLGSICNRTLCLV